MILETAGKLGLRCPSASCDSSSLCRVSLFPTLQDSKVLFIFPLPKCWQTSSSWSNAATENGDSLSSGSLPHCRAFCSQQLKNSWPGHSLGAFCFLDCPALSRSQLEKQVGLYPPPTPPHTHTFASALCSLDHKTPFPDPLYRKRASHCCDSQSISLVCSVQLSGNL